MPLISCCRILHESAVIADLHSETAGWMQAFATMATMTDSFDPVLFRLVVEVGVRKAALHPMLFGYDVAYAFREQRLTGGHQAGITHRDWGSGLVLRQSC